MHSIIFCNHINNISDFQNISKNWSTKVNIFDPNFEPNILSFFDSLLLTFWDRVSIYFYVSWPNRVINGAFGLKEIKWKKRKLRNPMNEFGLTLVQVNSLDCIIFLPSSLVPSNQTNYKCLWLSKVLFSNKARSAHTTLMTLSRQQYS
jgi:hypothetical protein